MSHATPPQIAHDILLVEDNLGDVVLLTKAFEDVSADHRIHVAVNGEEALAFLRRKGDHASAPTPSIILLDLNLPGKDGREVLTEVKQDPELRRIPIVILTSSHSTDDVCYCYDYHANAYMTKADGYDQLVRLAEGIISYWLTAVMLPPE